MFWVGQLWCAYYAQDFYLRWDWCIITLRCDCYVCLSIKFVSKKGKNKLCLIIDLWCVNRCIDTPSVKYEDSNTAIDQVKLGDQLISVDLKHVFQHILVHPEFWVGLHCSHYYFCTILRIVANYLHSQSITVCVYLDDIRLVALANIMLANCDLLVLTLCRGWVGKSTGRRRSWHQHIISCI